jgi:hypothetical protein
VAAGDFISRTLIRRLSRVDHGPADKRDLYTVRFCRVRSGAHVMNAVTVRRKRLPSLHAVITSDDPNGREHGGRRAWICEQASECHMERASGRVTRRRGQRTRTTSSLDRSLELGSGYRLSLSIQLVLLFNRHSPPGTRRIVLPPLSRWVVSRQSCRTVSVFSLGTTTDAPRLLFILLTVHDMSTYTATYISSDPARSDSNRRQSASSSSSARLWASSPR